MLVLFYQFVSSCRDGETRFPGEEGFAAATEPYQLLSAISTMKGASQLHSMSGSSLPATRQRLVALFKAKRVASPDLWCVAAPSLIEATRAYACANRAALHKMHMLLAPLALRMFLTQLALLALLALRRSSEVAAGVGSVLRALVHAHSAAPGSPGAGSRASGGAGGGAAQTAP